MVRGGGSKILATLYERVSSWSPFQIQALCVPQEGKGQGGGGELAPSPCLLPPTATAPLITTVARELFPLTLPTYRTDFGNFKVNLLQSSLDPSFLGVLALLSIAACE